MHQVFLGLQSDKARAISSISMTDRERVLGWLMRMSNVWTVGDVELMG